MAQVLEAVFTKKALKEEPKKETCEEQGEPDIARYSDFEAKFGYCYIVVDN